MRRALVRFRPVCLLVSLSMACLTLPAAARQDRTVHEWTNVVENEERPGVPSPHVAKAVNDTIWIADWSFDPGCTNAFNDDTSEGEQVPGWFRSDLRILNDGNVYWRIRSEYSGASVDTLGPGPGDDAFISGNAAACTDHNLCWALPDRYGRYWYQAIRIPYVGDSWLSFDVLIDTEQSFDLLLVETDSACASANLVDYGVNPKATGADFRDVEASASGLTGVHYDSLALSGYGTLDTHCVYIAFREDGVFWDTDCGCIPPGGNLGAALVVDNVVLSGAYPSSEDWDGGGTGASGEYEFVNLRDATPFGVWTRVFRGITDNDLCTGNVTCAWLDTDHTNPTIANVAAQAFAPNSFVMKNWRDTAVIGPWVSLASTPDALGTVLSFRRFPGNSFNTSRGVQNWSVRSKTRIANTDTPAFGDSIDCVTEWSHAFQWNSLNTYAWVTNLFDMSSNVAVGAREIQLRFRQSDWRWIQGASAPSPFQPAPGPFWDRVRIGRHVLTGPAINEGIDNRNQAQDGAPTNGNESGSYPGPNWAQDPNGDIFGTTSFTRGDSGRQFGPLNMIVGDSITLTVTDVRGAGGIASVNWYGRIVRGPHAGKAPAPYTVGTNGFFCIPADTSYSGGLQYPGHWAVDMDDTYFRGGDEVHSFWLAADVQGGSTSHPPGLSGEPADPAEAQAATGGLFEVSYLPTIEWAPAYLARIAADAHGDLAPTQAELDSSRQANCLLYYNHVNSRRYSGDAHRTSFMQTLDQLGYRGQYDVYDHSGLGNTNNSVGARMTVAQARDYALIVMDAGNRSTGTPIISDGFESNTNMIDMDTWFVSWLQAVGQGTSIPNHTLWLIGKDWAQEGNAVQLQAQAQVTFVAPNQATNMNPIVVGQQSHPVFQGCGVNAPLVSWSLDGGCPLQDYDAIAPLGVATETHTYDDNGTSPIAAPGTGKGAIVMHTDAAYGSNTIMQSHAWSDIRDFGSSGLLEPEEILLAQVLNCVLPVSCRMTPDPAVDVPGDAADPAALPARTTLHPNVPNPFNPTTTIRFDLARAGHVRLHVYDVAGRLVRRLIDTALPAQRDHVAAWDGLDEAGARVSSGVYLYRLMATDVDETRKMLLLK